MQQEIRHFIVLLLALNTKLSFRSEKKTRRFAAFFNDFGSIENMPFFKEKFHAFLETLFYF